ncbi:hypothetical protein GCM10025866_20180 [Naasia aerilata]|uniref:butyrate kinase n=1 Tax=Naasia aerilata TaxID=1162966 RepID=A0ABM8GCY0_9MICO|nr:hypothetical protein GCM10025866_20180 [Naasia aerilata]
MTAVLVVNSGSSSLKYQLIETEGERTLAKGLIERIGQRSGASTHSTPEGSGTRSPRCPTTTRPSA